MTSKDASQGGLSFVERTNPVRVCLRTWYVLVMGSRANAVTPKDMPSYRTRERAWNVLIVGTGPTHGWGVSTHKQSLVGQLAVAMKGLRNQPVDVDYIGDEMMNARTARAWLRDAPLNKYDQIIVAVGWNDAVRATPDHVWEASIGALMDDIHDRRSRTARVVMIGIEPITASSGYSNLLGRFAQGFATRFNVFLAGLAERNEDEFISLSARPQDKESRLGSARMYKQWAAEIALVAAPLLPGGDPGRRQLDSKPKFNWAGAERMLGLDGGDATSSLKVIEDQAKAYFKVHIAQVAMLDGNTQWFPTHEGPTPTSVPTELTYCKYTAQQEDILVIPNAKKDERFKDNAYVDQIHMPFYAGKSLTSRAGDVVGTFCVMDFRPRSKKLLDEAKFDEFAAEAQAAVWRIEDEAVAAGSRA